MQNAERNAIMRQGVVLPETPRQRRERAALEEDLRSIALSGKPLPIRARHFRPSADAYLLATRGPLPYMLRLREIEQRTEAHEATLRAAWLALADECGEDDARFRLRWAASVRAQAFDDVNDLMNLTDGVGGPTDPQILCTPAAIAAELPGLEIEKAERVLRDVAGEERDAIDALVRARRLSPS